MAIRAQLSAAMPDLAAMALDIQAAHEAVTTAMRSGLDHAKRAGERAQDCRAVLGEGSSARL